MPGPVGIAPEVEFPETGKAPDVVVPSAVLELPEGSAVTVTTEAPDDVPEAEMEAAVDVRFPEIGKSLDVLPEGSAVTVTTGTPDDVLYPELRIPEEVPFPETDEALGAVLPEGSAVTVTTEAVDDVPEAEVEAAADVEIPEIGKALDVVLPEGPVVTVTTEAADDVLDPELRAPEVRLPDTGKTSDFVVLAGAPVPPEGSAVTVTIEGADDVPGAPELAAGSDVPVGEPVSVPLGGQAVTVTGGVVVDDEPESEVTLEELALAETGNALDVAVPSEVPVLREDPVLPVGPAVTVTVPAGSSVLSGPEAVTVTVFGASSVSDPSEALESGNEDTDGVIVTVAGVDSGSPGRPIEMPTERPSDTVIGGLMENGSVGQAGPSEVPLLSKGPEELAADSVARLDVNKSEDTLGKMVMVTGSFPVAVGAVELLGAENA